MCCVDIVGGSAVCDSVKHSGLLEPRDTEFDLSEADFAPAHCAVLLKSCMANGDEPDSQAFNTTVSESSLSLHEHHVVVNETFSRQAHMTCDGVQNGEDIAVASFQHDAIGLPLCTENLAASNCYGTLTANNDVLLQHDTAAAERLSISCDDHTGRHDVHSDPVRSSDYSVRTVDLSSVLNVSTLISSFGGEDIAGPHDELGTCLVTDKNITWEESDAVDAVDTNDDNIVHSAMPAIDDDLSCETSSEIELSEQNNGKMQLDVTGCRDVSVPSDDIRSLAAQNVKEVQGEVQGETEIQIQQGESLSVDNIKGFEVMKEDSQIVKETLVAEEESVTLAVADSCVAKSALTSTDDVDELDDGTDEVDKTVSTSHHHVKSDLASATESSIDTDEVVKTVSALYHIQSHPAPAVVSSFDAESAVCPESDHLPEHISDLNVTNVACSESSWFEADGTEAYGIDHVERITTDNVDRLKVDLNHVSCSDLVDKDSSHAAYGLEFSSDVHEAVDVNEIAVCTTAGTLCETDIGDTYAVTSTVSVQLDALSPVDHTASLLAETAVSFLEENPVHIADGTYDMPAAGSENQLDSSESLQKQVSGDICLSHVSEVTAVTQPDNEPLSVNDAGDAQNVELCKQEGDHGDSNSSQVIDVNNAVSFDTEPVPDSEWSMVEAGHDVQLNSDMSDVTVEKSSAKASTKLPLQNSDFLMAGSRNEEQDSCGLNNTVMPNAGLGELSGLEDTVSGELMTVDSSPFNPHTSNDVTMGFEDNERDRSAVDAVAETQTQSTDDLPERNQDQMETMGQSAEGQQGMERQSEEDAERWFEEQFAACEDFDVEEFVSSAWSEFHPDLTDSTPAVGNIRDEMLKQHPTAMATTVNDDNDSDGDAGECEVGSADAWNRIENATVAASAIDDLMHTSSGEVSQFVDGEMMDAEACYIPPSDVQHSEPSAPGIIVVDLITP